MKKLIVILTASAGLFGCGGEQDTAAGGKTYPLDTCIVSGEKLGSHGEVVSIEHEGQQVKFCCSPCIEDFNKEPAKFLTKLDGKLETEGSK